MFFKISVAEWLGSHFSIADTSDSHGLSIASWQGVNPSFTDLAFFLPHFWELGVGNVTNYLWSFVFCMLDIIGLFGDGNKNEISCYV